MLDDLFGLQGQVALVTGAGRGIGQGIAETLAKAGASVVCAARRTHEIEAVANGITAGNGSAIAVPTDVTDNAALSRAVQTAIDTYGRLDILVNNAGGSPVQAPLMELPREEWDATFALNLTAIFECCRAAVPHMTKGGRIVNISSVSAEDIWAGSGHYSAAKAGVNMLTKALARELGPDIRVNAIMPGLVPTEIVREALNLTDADLPALQESLQLPSGRLGTPEDLGAAVLYLCSAASSWVTGQCIRVSGGG